MRRFGRFVVVSVLFAGVILLAAGCSGGEVAAGGGNCAKTARLYEDENARLVDRINLLEKEITSLKAAGDTARLEVEKENEAREAAMSFLMDQIAERDAQIVQLQEKIAGMEKAATK
jgi:DNA-binding transcriptional MerR regulator